MAATARARLSRGILGRLRLASQGLAGSGFGSVPAAVRWMTAMQAQDLQAALWAVGQRVPGSRVGDVRSALDRGEIVRSWPMRGTLHLLAPEDLKWMLAITSDRLIRGLAGRHRELGITAADVDAAAGTALQLVSGGAAASRAELFQAFERAGQSTAGQRGIHLLGILCQRGWLVQGPLAGNQQLVVAFDDWITESRTLDRADGIAEWLLRYLRSHGPATERDFSWWSGIPLTEVRAALARVRDQLEELTFEGTSYWLSAGDGRPARRRRPRRAPGAGTARIRRVPARLHGPVARAAAGACRQDRPGRQRRLPEDDCCRRPGRRHLGRVPQRPGRGGGPRALRRR